MTAAFRYKAFISYAHEDDAFAAEIHDRLERFVVPRQLRSDPSAGRRLGTFFRDRDELASGGSLSDRITEALTESEYLIVVCSQAAAESPWVGREVEAFVRHRSLDDVLLVVAPSVARGDIPVPEALRGRDELLAADARPFADGYQRATLKLVAGLIRVPFDALVQRERLRRRRRLLALSGGAAVLAATVALAVFLVRSASREAEARRQQAATFVGVFVDSLDERIRRYERVGTLDADLERALEFFSTLPPDEIDPTTLQHYRTALLAVGTVRIRQGKPQAALDAFHRALELSQSMVERQADDASRWYELAMHTYYIGEAHWEMQNFTEATARIVESLGYAERAAELAPDKFEYQLEVVYALNNLGAVSTRSNDYAGATEALERSIRRIEELRADNPERATDLLTQEVEAVSWLAEIAQKRSDYLSAFDWHEREVGLRTKLIELTGNPHHISRLSDALGYYAQSLMAVGRTDRAVEALQDQVATAERAVATDLENAFFRERLHMGKAILANALFEDGRLDAAMTTLDEAERGMQEMIEKDQQATALSRDLSYVASSRAYFLLRSDPAAALTVANAAIERASRDLDRQRVDPIVLGYYVRCASVLAAAERMLGRPASESIRDALALAEAHGSRESSSDLASRVILLHALGRHEDARPLEKQLEASGFRPVFYRTILEAVAPASGA